MPNKHVENAEMKVKTFKKQETWAHLNITADNIIICNTILVR